MTEDVLVPPAQPVRLIGQVAIAHAVKHGRPTVDEVDLPPIETAAARALVLSGMADPARFSVVVWEVPDPVTLLARATSGTRSVWISRNEQLPSYRKLGEAVLVEIWEVGGQEPVWRDTGVTIGHALWRLGEFLESEACVDDHANRYPCNCKELRARLQPRAIADGVALVLGQWYDMVGAHYGHEPDCVAARRLKELP
jgi:hypothetical protein